jgi:serine/threonine protein phosphatase PrpC
MCTDGWWEYVEEPEMERLLDEAASPEAWLARMGEAIRQRAPAENDNYTAVCVKLAEETTVILPARGTTPLCPTERIAVMKKLSAMRLPTALVAVVLAVNGCANMDDKTTSAGIGAAVGVRPGRRWPSSPRTTPAPRASPARWWVG